ncbi:MAG: transcriptional regulator [Thaumarchaeota archaeon]|nr:transcriptional regulator [Nitrososphaerota archaeon]
MPPESGLGGSGVGKGEEDLVSDVGLPGPFSVSTRVGIMTALLGFKRTTFTELLLAVKTPKSSLNKNLGILEDYGFIKQRRAFVLAPGPRTVIEITPEGEEATKKHLELMRALADRFLGPKEPADSKTMQ